MSRSVSSSASPSPAIVPLVVPIEEKPITNRNSRLHVQKVVSGLGIPPLFEQQTIPSWNTIGRPKKPRIGTIGFNIQTINLEFWTGSQWVILRMKKI